MRTFISIALASLLLFSSLLPGFGVKELQKIPLLLEHYKEHKQKAGKLFSFLDFLKLHYATEHGKSGCHHEGMPFLNISAGLSFILSDFHLSFRLKPVPVISSKVQFTYTNNYSFQSVFCILQPPRI
jgi:hypothetical protein